MNLNLMDRNALAAMIFNDSSLNSHQTLPKLPKKQQTTPLPPPFTIEKVAKTFSEIQQKLNDLNPLGIVEQKYFSSRPSTTISKRTPQPPQNPSNSPSNQLFLTQTYGPGKRISKQNFAPKTVKIHQKPLQRDEITSNFDYKTDTPQFISQSGFQPKPSSQVRKMRSQVVRQQENIVEIPPQIQFSAPQKIKSPEKEVKKQIHQVTVSPSHKTTDKSQLILLEKALKMKIKQAEMDLSARLNLRFSQNKTALNKLKKELKGLKNQTLDEIQSAQKKLSEILQLTRRKIQNSFQFFTSISTQPLQYVEISQDFSVEFQQRFMEFSSIFSFWQTRGQVDCGGCMRFLGMNSEQISFAVSQFYIDQMEGFGEFGRSGVENGARSGEEEKDVGKYLEGNQAQNASETLQIGQTDLNATDLNEYTQKTQKATQNRFTIFPCGDSVCANCAAKTTQKCPICFNQVDLIVENRSGNNKFNSNLSDKMSKVLSGLREVCEVLGFLGEIDCEGVKRVLERVK